MHTWLRKLTLLAGVPDKELARVRIASKKLAAGATLFSMGDHADAAFIVVSGRLKISRIADADGRELLIDIVGPGAVLGELALFGDAPRSATIAALSASELVSITRKDFLAIIRAHPDFAIDMLTVLANKVRSVSVALEESAYLDLGTRLARRLIDLARRFGKHEGDEVTLDVPLAQHDLAKMIGVSREAVNKQLRTWEDARVITLRRGKVIINDLAWLTDTARFPSPRE